MVKAKTKRVFGTQAGRLALALVFCAALACTGRAQDFPQQMPELSLPTNSDFGSASSGKMQQGIQLLQAGKLKEADAAFGQVATSDPAYLDASLGRAQIAITQKQLDQADRMVTAVLQRQDKLPEAHNMKGVVLLLRKNPDGAKKEFQRAIELDPKYVTPRVYLAVMARVRHDYAAAADQYKALTLVAPHLQTGYLGEAESLTAAGHPGDAMRVLEDWKKADPKTLKPYQVIANIDLASRKPQDAIRQLQAALAKSPHDSVTLTILGTAYADAGDLRSAENAYQAAIAASNNDVDATVRLGELQAATGQTDKAIANFRRALQLDPKNAFALNNIAWLEADRSSNLDEALRMAQSAVKIAPRYADARDTLGWVYYRRGNYAAAVASLKEAKALAPANPSIAGHLGLALAKTGQKQQALAELRRALAGANVSDRPEAEREVAELSGGGGTKAH